MNQIEKDFRKASSKQDFINFLNEYVVSGKVKIFNKVSKEFTEEVTESNVDSVAEIIHDMFWRGINLYYLSFIEIEE